MVVSVDGNVGAVTAPTQAQKGLTDPGPLLQSAACGVGQVTEQVCGGVSAFVAPQEESASAAAGIRNSAAASQARMSHLTGSS